jgi:2-polyprenyl-3-methyl-5-hydroxy-6-metoxy-1,4-benzoquinol methylase
MPRAAISNRETDLTPCVLCGAEDFEDLSQRARDGQRHRTTICRRCGMVWANPPPSRGSVRTYYSDEYRHDYKGTKVRTLPQIYHAGIGAIARYRAARVLLTPGAAVLDIGCGGGELVYLLRRFGIEAQGVEPDAIYSEQARRDLGLPVSTGFVEDMSFPDASFSVMLMYHVLEHIDGPVALLARLRPLLTDDGLLVVEVPNIEATREAPMTRFHVAHLSYFSPETLAAVGRAAGFGVRGMRVSDDGGTMTAIFTARPGPDVPHSPAVYRQITDILRRHTTAGYYLSATPYLRMIGRLRTWLRKRAVSRQFTGGKQILDKLFADASAGSENP